MKDPEIRKADLLVKLNEIYAQLEELENVLHSTYLNQQQGVRKLQTERLDTIEEKIGAFEADINQANNEKTRFRSQQSS